MCSYVLTIRVYSVLVDINSHEVRPVVLLQAGCHFFLLELLWVVVFHLHGPVACLSHSAESVKMYMGAWHSSKSRLVSSQSALCCGQGYVPVKNERRLEL